MAIMTICEEGEWIDGSVLSDYEMSLKIIEIAQDQGFKPDSFNKHDEMEVYEISEEAINFLNENSPLDGYIWGINAEWCSFGLWKLEED